MNRTELVGKLGAVTSKLIKEKGYISLIDVFVELQYLDAKDVESWRMKRIPYLEKCIKVNLGKVSFIVKTVVTSCKKGNLKPSYTNYVSWGKGPKKRLQFSKSGSPNIENIYSTHYVKQRTMA